MHGVEMVARLGGARRSQRVSVYLDVTRGRDRVGGYGTRLLGVIVTSQVECTVLEEDILAYHVFGTGSCFAAVNNSI